MRIGYTRPDVNYEKLAGQVVRRVRGTRRQRELCQALGYRSNVISSWETGRDIPQVQTFFRLLMATGRDPQALFSSFRRVPEGFDARRQVDVGRFLNQLRGNRSLVELASEVRMDRYLLSRTMKGQSEPRLDDFLELIDATTLSVVDFLSLIVDPLELPEVSERAELESKARMAARQFPWAQGVLLLAQLPEYQALERHLEGWFAARLGRSVSEERRCLELLVELGRLTYCSGRYRPSPAGTAVDTRMDRQLTRAQAAFWMKEAAARGEDGREVRLGFNVFSVSRADLTLLREIQDRYFAEMRAVISKSQPEEVAAVTLFSTFVL